MALKAILTYKSNKKNVEQGVGRFIDRAVKASTREMERNVKKMGQALFYKRQDGEKRKHRRTGHLLRSVRSEHTGFGKGEIQINPIRHGADVNYGLFVEYGTRFMTPRPFIRRGVAASEKRIKEIFRDEARKVTDRASGL